MVLIVFVILLIFSMYYKQSRLVSFSVLVFMFVLFSFSNYTGDQQTYYKLYEAFPLYNHHFEPIYNNLMSVCKSLGLSFTGFRMVLATIFVVFFYNGVSKITRDTAAVLSVSVIFPFLPFTSVIRSGMAMAFIINGLAETFGTKKKPNYIKSCIYFILAIGFHYSSVLLVVFLFAPKMKESKKYLVGAFFLLFIIVIGLRMGVYHIVPLPDILSVKIDVWIKEAGDKANLMGSTVILFLLLLTTFLMYLVKNERAELFQMETISHNEYEQAVIIYNMSIIEILFFPLMISSSPFLRMAYMVFPIMVANTFYNSNETYKMKSSLNAIQLFIVVLALLWIFYFELPYVSDTVYPYTQLLNTEFIIYE